MKQKAAEFVSSGAELYQGELPAGAQDWKIAPAVSTEPSTENTDHIA